MTNAELIDFCREHNACAGGIARLHETGNDLATTWATSVRGDWMLWLAEKMGRRGIQHSVVQHVAYAAILRPTLRLQSGKFKSLPCAYVRRGTKVCGLVE